MPPNDKVRGLSDAQRFELSCKFWEIINKNYTQNEKLGWKHYADNQVSFLKRYKQAGLLDDEVDLEWEG